MHKRFTDRLAALERRPIPNHNIPAWVLLLGDECDAFDAARAAGDDDAAVAVLARGNPEIPEWMLREYFLNAPEQDLSPPLIRMEYTDGQ